MNDLTERLVRNAVRAQSDTLMADRIAALENFVVEVRDCVPDLFGADHDLIDAAVVEAFQAHALELMPLDAPSDLIAQSNPNTRVVTVEQLERWHGQLCNWTCQDEISDIIAGVM